MLARTDLPPIAIRGPKPPPLIGPLGRLLHFFADPVARMIALHREYGDVAAVADGNAALVCAFGAEHNHTVITQPAAFEHLSEVPIPVRPGTAFARFNNTVLFKNGEAHRRRRRLLMPAFSKAAVEGYAPEMVAVADEMMEKWPIGRATDVSALLRDLTIGIALRCLFGLRGQDGTDELGRLETALLATIASPLAMLLPLDVPGTPFSRALHLSERVEDRIRRLIADKRRNPGGTDALSRLIEARDEEGALLDEADLIGEANSLFAAGFDTSAHTLTWTLLLLATHPEVLDDVTDEIRTVLQGERPTIDRLPELGRLDRVVKESMRLLPTPVLLFMRTCNGGAKLGSIALPKGAQVILSPIVTHRDPALYPAPQRFDPERWRAIEPSPYAYLPFGAGARMCIGAAFATVSLRLSLARVLQRVRPVLPEGARVDYAVRGPAMGPKGGLPLTLVPAGSRARSGRVRGNVHTLVDFP
ncbi:MAG: cytochrome P450 [Minicystis sp.]